MYEYILFCFFSYVNVGRSIFFFFTENYNSALGVFFAYFNMRLRSEILIEIESRAHEYQLLFKIPR